MIDATEFLSKVITIRGISGEEIIGTLLGVDLDSQIYIVNEPRLVVINNNEVTLLPYLLTCDQSGIAINSNTVVSLHQTSVTIAKEYQEVIASENLAKETVDAELVEE